MCGMWDQGPRLRHRAAAPMPAPSVRRSTSGIAIANATSGFSSQEIDGLIAQGVTYIYFHRRSIFLPRPDLLLALKDRDIRFGIQTRIDLWKPELLDLLGAAGCVSIEAGVESLTVEGRALLAKKCKLDTDQLSALLMYARRSVPFVQANLIRAEENEMPLVAEWRAQLHEHGVWANDPVPLFPYPSSPEYRRDVGHAG